MGSLKGNVPIGEKMRLAHEGSELTLDDGGSRATVDAVPVSSFTGLR